MMTDKEIAEFLRIGLSLQLVSCGEVERWADTVIEREAAPRYPIVKLALAGELPRSDVLELLSEVKGDLNAKHPPRLFLAFLRKRLVENGISLELTITGMFALYQSPQSGLTGSEENQIITLEDTWSLARDGIHGDAVSVQSAVMRFLQDYDAYEKDLPV